MRTTNVKRQLAINEYPNVIVTGEEELDAGFFLFSIYKFVCFNFAVIRQGKIHLQLGAKAVIVGRSPAHSCGFVEREVAIGTDVLSIFSYCFLCGVRIKIA